MRIFVLSVLLSMALLSCGKTMLNAQLGTAVKLKVDQSVSYEGEDLNVKMISVTEDSRCPQGANCIWEGQVIVNLKIDQATILVNTQQVLDTLGYSFSIVNVLPIKTDEAIDQGSYTIELLVTK